MDSNTVMDLTSHIPTWAQIERNLFNPGSP